MPEIVQLRLSIEPQSDSELGTRVSRDSDVLSRLQVTVVEVNLELLESSQTERVSVLSLLELKRHNTHSNQVGAMNTLVRLGNDSLNTLEERTLGGPITRGTRSVSLTSQDNEGVSLLDVLLSSIKHIHHLLGGAIDGLGSGLANELVDQTDVGEGTTGHDLVVTTPGTVGVELLGLNTVLVEVTGSGGLARDVSGGGDVIGGDRVSDVQQDVGTLDVGGLGGLEGHAVKVRGKTDVGGLGVPLVQGGLVDLEVLPRLRSGLDVLVDVLEEGGLDDVGDDLLDLLLRGPDVLQEDLLSVLGDTDGLLVEVLGDGPSQSEGNAKRGRGEVVGTGLGVNTTLEVTVTRQNSGGNQVTVGDGLSNLRGDVTGVTDTGHATVTDDGVTQLVEVGLESGLFQVPGDNTGTGGERGLDVGLDGQTSLDGLLGEDTSSQHDGRVRGVGARGDGRDDDVTVGHLDLLALIVELDDGGLLLLGDIESLEADLVVQALLELGGESGESDTILGPLGSSQRGDNRAKVQGQVRGVLGGLGGSLEGAEELLGLQVLLNVGDLLLRAASLDEVLDGGLIDGEETHGGSVLGGHVGESGTVLDGHGLQTITKVLDELADTSVLPQLLSDSEDQIGGGGTRGELALQLEPNNLGEDHGDLLTAHDGLSLQTTNTPSTDTETVDHRGVRVGTDNRVRVQKTVLVKDGATEELQVDLMNNTGTRGDNEEIVKGLSTPLQEAETLVVPLHLNFLILLEGSLVPSRLVDLDGVIDDKIDRDKRVDLLGVTTQVLHGLTHSGQIDNSRDTGEILENDTSGKERNLGLSLVVSPVEDGLNMSLGEPELIAVTNGTLQQDTNTVRQGFCRKRKGVSFGGRMVIWRKECCPLSFFSQKNPNKIIIIKNENTTKNKKKKKLKQKQKTNRFSHPSCPQERSTCTPFHQHQGS